MAFSISQFSSHMSQKGVLQNNKFEVLITPPPVMTGASVGGSSTILGVSKDLMFRCANATLPGIALRTVDSNRFGIGVQEKMVFTGNYTDIDLTFYADRKGDLYTFWYAWMNLVFSTNGLEFNNPVTVGGNPNKPFYTAEYKDNYASPQIDIRVYDTSGNKALTYSLAKAYPIALNDVPVSWDSTNQLLKISAKITFREWALTESINVVRPETKLVPVAPLQGTIGQNEFNPQIGKYNGILGTGAETPTFDG